MSGCPYISGPACSDCDGSCWEWAGPAEHLAPDPCEVCTYVTDAMTHCLGYCGGISNQADLDARIAAYRNGELA